MTDIFKNAILTGVGLASLTTEKVKEAVDELKEKGNLSEKEGRELAENLLKKSDQTQKDLEKRVHKEIEKVLGKLDLASKADIKKLAVQLRKIEKAVDAKTKA